MNWFYIGLDVEGPLVNPAADFAWLSYDNLLSKRIKAIFPRDVCEFYDNKYDEGRYLWELKTRKRKKYSAGKWPLLSLCLAACDGIDDNRLIKYARKTTQENPGASKLIKHLIKKHLGRLYLITNSYPAVPLIISYKYNIPDHQVFSMGTPLSIIYSSFESLEEEVRSRLPLYVPASLEECLLHNPLDKLKNFLERYLYICERLGKAYETENKIQIRYLLKEHDKLFEELSPPYLKRYLKDMFLEEEWCMGSHRKVEAMKFVSRRKCRLQGRMGKLWIYVGDGIDDAMPLKFADYGISINTTNKHALQFSKLNVATTNVSNLIPIFDSIFSNKFDPERLKNELSSDELKIFTQKDILKSPDKVIEVNREMKNALKKLFKEP